MDHFYIGLLKELLRPSALPPAVLTGFLFMLPLQKRLKRGMLVLVMAASVLLSCLLMQWFHGHAWFSDAQAGGQDCGAGPHWMIPETSTEVFLAMNAELIVGVLLLTVLFLICCRVGWAGSFYRAVCAYLIQDLFSMFVSFLPETLRDHSIPPRAGAAFAQILVTVLFFLLIYNVIVVKISGDGMYPENAVVKSVLLLAVMAVNRFLGASLLSDYNVKTTHLFLYFLFYSVLLFVILLLVQAADGKRRQDRRRTEAERRIFEQKKAAEKMDNISSEIIHRNAHDLKYLLTALRNENVYEAGTEAFSPGIRRILDEIEQAVGQLEICVDTGNDALDVILSDAWQTCRDKEIQWTCMADGAALDMVEPVDLHIMLGNALENAIEAAEKVTDPERRFLSVNIRARERMAFVRIENYCEEMSVFQQDVLVSTKADPATHGMGISSIRSVAARYGGEVNISVEDRIFTMTIFLPMN